MAKREYNLETSSYERMKQMSLHDVNKLLGNLYSEAYDEGVKDASANNAIPKKFVTEDELKEIISDIKGIGDTRRKEILKRFRDINKKRGDTGGNKTD